MVEIRTVSFDENAKSLTHVRVRMELDVRCRPCIYFNRLKHFLLKGGILDVLIYTIYHLSLFPLLLTVHEREALASPTSTGSMRSQ